MTRLLLSLALLIGMVTPTVAQDDWVRRVLREERRRDYQAWLHRQRLAEQRRQYELVYQRGQVYGWVQRIPDSRHRPDCIPQPRSVVGLEKYNVDEARANARHMWMEAEKLHNGVKYMNPDNALVIEDDCYVSSTGNRGSEKAAESVGRARQQCVFTARACVGPADDERKR